MGRKLTPRDFLIGGGKIGLLGGRQSDDRFIATRELQEESRDGILRFGGQGAYAFNGVFEQLGRVPTYHESPPRDR